MRHPDRSRSQSHRERRSGGTAFCLLRQHARTRERYIASNRNRLSLSQLKRKIHRSRANRPRPMTDSPRNREHLSRSKLSRSALKLNAEPPFNNQKSLIRVRMKVPMVRLDHRGNANDMVIDLSNRMIIVSRMRRRLCRQRDDLWKLSIHRQSSRSNLIRRS
jgi:hypothetical protein